MVIQAIWATIVLLCKNEQAISTFHRFGEVVWLIWLVPFFTGFFISIVQPAPTYLPGLYGLWG